MGTKKRRYKGKVKRRTKSQRQAVAKPIPKQGSTPSFEAEERLIISDLKKIGIITGIILLILLILFLLWR